MSYKKIFIFVSIIAFFFVFILFATEVQSRPGGGHSYSGGSSSFSSSSSSWGGSSSSSSWGSSSGYSSSGGGGGSISGPGGWIIITLVIIFVVIGFVIDTARKKKRMPKNFGTSMAPPVPPKQRSNAIANAIKTVKADDPNFSYILFLDFANSVYNSVQRYRGKGKIEQMAFYLDPNLLNYLKTLQYPELEAVEAIVIGALNIDNVRVQTNEIRIDVRIESNYTEVINRAGKKSAITFYSYEKWTFARTKGVLSRTPEDISRINCPNCGAGLDINPEGRCNYCNEMVQPGSKHWKVKNIKIEARETRKPDMIGGYVAEVGTNFPTVFDPNLGNNMKNLQQKDSSFTLESFMSEAKDIFIRIYNAYSSRKWEDARPYETDNLFNSHLYWIELYKKAGYFNRLANINIYKAEVAKVDEDAFFDTVTVRFHVSCLDYMTNEQNKVIGGNAKSPRRFTEYWTFVRRKNAKKPAGTKSQCPNCGAELKIGMSGECEYCGSKVTTGDFGWVLGLIEQDDEYAG